MGVRNSKKKKGCPGSSNKAERWLRGHVAYERYDSAMIASLALVLDRAFEAGCAFALREVAKKRSPPKKQSPR